MSLSHNTYETIAGSIFVVSLLKNILENKNLSKVQLISRSLKTLLFYEYEQNNFDMSSKIALATYLDPKVYIEKVIRKKGDWGFLANESIPVLCSTYLQGENSVNLLLQMINFHQLHHQDMQL